MDLESRIGQIVRRHWDAQPIPGMAVVVTHRSETIFLRCYGVASLEARFKVQAATVFPIASLTKQFVAALVVVLARQGWFSIDDSIAGWFPESETFWSDVTIRDLLCHLSGISDEPYHAVDDQQAHTTDDLVYRVASQPLVRPPGTKFEYCNSGYVLLGALIRRVTGRDYGDALSENLFFPLRMESAQVYNESIPNLATGYESDGDAIDIESWVHPSLCTPADGGLCMSIADLAKWCTRLSSPGSVLAGIFEECWTPARLRDGSLAGYSGLRIGMGWMIPAVKTLPGLVQHEGAFRGFTSYIGHLPSHGLSVAVAMNIDDEIAKPKAAGQEILATLI